MISRGRFSNKDAIRALTSPDIETKQVAARWLRRELKIVRAGQSKTGAAPVLKGEALSPLVIADLAMTMVENFADDIGDDLVCLLQELLEVDRHRRALAKVPSEKFQLAAQIVAQRNLQGWKAQGVARTSKNRAPRLY